MVNVNPVLAKGERNNVIEAYHRGCVVVTSPTGEVEWFLGDIEAIYYPRSATKLFQAWAMLDCGLDTDNRLLASAVSSHSGEKIHLTATTDILSGAGLSLTDLQNTPDLPLDELASLEWIRAGHGKESITQNCSGKHASMLRTCVINHWQTADYRDPSHPLQQRITELVNEWTTNTPKIGIDGCGAPAHTMNTIDLAKAFGHVAAAKSGHTQQLANAMRAYPEYVSGTRRWEAKLFHIIPGLICKIGAEGAFGIGLPDGRGIAIKIDDGSSRALPTIAVAVLNRLGFTATELAEIGKVPVLGHGEVVGEIRSVI